MRSAARTESLGFLDFLAGSLSDAEPESDAACDVMTYPSIQGVTHLSWFGFALLLPSRAGVSVRLLWRGCLRGFYRRQINLGMSQ